MPTESGLNSMENQSANIEDMFSDDKYQLEEGLNALNNRPLNPLEEVQQRLAQQYNQQQENPTGNVENVSPDKGEGMVESASVEAKQEVAIEKVATEADHISPDFGNGVKAELQETARESLKMKIEVKVYDLLTDIERKIGQGIAMQQVRESFRLYKSLAKEWKAGKVFTSGLDNASQYKIGQEEEEDIEIGESNLKNRIESVEFVPGGEVVPSSFRWSEGGYRQEKPYIDHTLNSGGERVRTSFGLMSAAMRAQAEIGRNPMIGTLEKWRDTLRERQASISGAKQLVSNYKNVG